MALNVERPCRKPNWLSDRPRSTYDKCWLIRTSMTLSKSFAISCSIDVCGNTEEESAALPDFCISTRLASFQLEGNTILRKQSLNCDSLVNNRLGLSPRITKARTHALAIPSRFGVVFLAASRFTVRSSLSSVTSKSSEYVTDSDGDGIIVPKDFYQTVSKCKDYIVI